MPSKQRMRLASQKHSQNVNHRGNVVKSLKGAEEKSPLGPYLLAFIIFVVCGSGVVSCGWHNSCLWKWTTFIILMVANVGHCAIFQIVQSIWMS